MIIKKIMISMMLFCCMTASCTNKVKKTVTGWWTIDTIMYRNYEIRACMLGNSFWFNNDGTIDLPIPENRCFEFFTEYNDKGDWKVMRGDSIPLLLKIESKNIIFRGTHQITFRDDTENDLLKMEIESDSLYVVCRKGLFDYDHKQKLIDELVRISNGSVR